MLQEHDVGAFNAFGFVVLRNCITFDELTALEGAYEHLMAKAPRYDYFGGGGTRMAMAAEEEDPIFADFIVHPKITQVMCDLWDVPALYLACDIWSNRDDTPWHTDGQPGRSYGTIKVTTYLDEMTAEQGSLNVIPGSHIPASSANLFRHVGYFDRSRPRLRLGPDSIPGAVSLHTFPGDVVIWDTRLWHSAFKRQDGNARRALFFSFVRDPQGDFLAEQFTRTCFEDHRKEEGESVYGPLFAGQDDSRARGMIERLEQLGIENVVPTVLP